MDGIVGRKMQGEILLFPIQHGITIAEIRGYSPSLAGLSLWNSSDHSFDEIAAEIAEQLGVGTQTTFRTTRSASRPASRSTGIHKRCPRFRRNLCRPGRNA